MSDRLALEIRNFSIRNFDRGTGHKVFDSISLDVLDGESLGWLSLESFPVHYFLEVIAGVRQPDHGSISVFGNPIDKSLDHIKRMIGIASEDSFLEPDLSIEQQIRFAGETFHLDDHHVHELMLQLAQQLNMEGLMDTLGSDLDVFQVRQVSLMRALIHSPQILILENPLEGLQNKDRRKMISLIQSIRSRVRTLLIMTHDFDGLESLMDRIVFFKDGSLFPIGAPDVSIEKYLGTQVVELITSGAEKDYFVKKLNDREIEILMMDDSLLIPLRQRSRESLLSQVLEGRYCTFREATTRDLLKYVSLRGGLT